MNKGRRRTFSYFLISLLSGILLFQIGAASVVETGNDIQFTALDRIEDDVYALSEKNISMDGFIDGDFTAFTNNVIINGEITGNGNFFCRKLDHNGKINRTLHSFAETVNINGIVTRSSLNFCSEFILSSNGLIERDLTVAAARSDIGGTVKGDAHIYAGEVRIFGVIEGDVEIEANSIKITAPAVIGGNLRYKSDTEIFIDTLGGVVIAGTIERDESIGEDESESEGFRSVVVTISELIAAFLFGLLILIPFRRHVKEAVSQLRSRTVIALATGFITVLIFLFAIAIAFVSLLTFVIGYLLISGDTPAAGAFLLTLSTIILPISSFSAVSGGILFYLGKIILAFLVGHLIFSFAKSRNVELSKSKLLVGLIALAIVFEIPYLGMILYLLGSLTGAGAIILAIRKITFDSNSEKPNEVSSTV